MLVIRLQRTGRENLPTYRLVVADKARPVKGKYLDIVGHYLPARNPVVFEHASEKIRQWIAKGAMPSNTVARLLKKTGMNGMEKFVRPYMKRKSKKDSVSAEIAAGKQTVVPEEISAAETHKTA